MGTMLLPFTHGIDNAALEQAITLAHDHGATLVPLSIICLSGHKESPRLELIQQSKDFLTLVQQKAARAAVPVESMERFTCEEVEVIQKVALELECAGILLFARQQKGVLLPSGTIQKLMHNRVRPCFLSSLPAHKRAITLPEWSFRMRPRRNAKPARQMVVGGMMKSVMEF
jgi:hypothetical protein